LATILAVTLAVTACAPAASTTTPTSESTQPGASSQPSATTPAETSELTFIFAANPDEAKTRQQVIDAFAAKNPDIKITTQRYGDDSVQQILTACAGGACPDVLMTFEIFYPALAERGIYADLTPFIESDPEFKATVIPDYPQDLVNAFRYDGKQIALPEQFAGMWLYYNKRLFEEAGVEPPPADWTDGSWTFERFLDAAKKLTKGSGDTAQYGFVDGWAPFLSQTLFAMNNGVAWFDPPVNPTSTNMRDDRFVEGLQFYADLANVHAVAPPADQAASISAPDLFTSGRAAMMLSGHFMWPTLASAEDLDFDVGVLPVGPSGTTPKSDIGVTGLGISEASKNKEAAWRFVKFFTGPEGQKIIAESGLFVPVLKTVADSESFLGTHGRVENVRTMSDAIDHVNYLPITPALNEFLPALQRESGRLLQGSITAREMADIVAAEIDKALEP
jgi:multiple sugar transport system substrate-binding protein